MIEKRLRILSHPILLVKLSFMQNVLQSSQFNITRLLTQPYSKPIHTANRSLKPQHPLYHNGDFHFYFQLKPIIS